MQKKGNFKEFWRIIVFMAAMTVFFTACQNDSSSDPVTGDDKPEIPAELQNTEWVHTSGDKIAFGKDSVTVTPSGGTAQTYSFKGSDSVSAAGIEQTNLYFKEFREQNDVITYRNGSVTMVNFSIINQANRTQGWSKGSGTSGNGNNNTGVYGMFSYSFNDYEVTITGFDPSIPEIDPSFSGTWRGYDITIPLTIEGKPVTTIGKDAFHYELHYEPENNKPWIKSLIIGNNVTHIEEYAFAGKSINNIIIPDSVIIIGKESFKYCGSENLIIGKNVTHIGEAAFFLSGEQRDKNRSIIIPDSVRSIGNNAFHYHHFTTITIGANVILESNSFYHLSYYNNPFQDYYNKLNKQAGTYRWTGTRNGWVRQ